MVSLVEAYQGGAIRDFERILRTHRAAIMGDTFISQYMQDLLANIRTQVGRRWGLSRCWGRELDCEQAAGIALRCHSPLACPPAAVCTWCAWW